MILLYGRGDDAPMRSAAEAASDAGEPMIWLDQCALDRTDLLLALDGNGASGVLRVDGSEIDLGSVSGIYARPLALPSLWTDALSRARAQACHELFLEWLEVSVGLVVNRPSDMESNSSKPYQAQLICAAGFEVPETLVTSDPDEARAFWREHERVVFKSVSGVRSIVRELDAEHAARLNRLRDLPVQLQKLVPGTDVRVHLVGDQAFACSVVSGVTDYRYAHRDGESVELRAIELPPDLAYQCADLARQLCLPLCGIDLRHTPDDRWVCFEINPMPAYTYFEDRAGLPISAALIELLAHGEPHPGK